MNKFNVGLILLAIATPVFAENPPAAINQPALTVSTVNPSSTKWSSTVSATGGLYAWQEAIIASEIGGLRIIEILADVGQVVKKGEVLALLAQDSVEASVAQRRAEVAQAQVVFNQAKADAVRSSKALRLSKGALSEQQVEQYQFAQERATAALDAVKAALRNEEIRLEKTRIYAADAGTISSRAATLGAVVQIGSELFRLVRQNRIEWRAEVTDQQLSQIQVKQKVKVTLPDGNIVKGKVRMIAPTLDQKTRKANVYVDLSNNKQIRAGMFAHGEIVISNSRITTLPVSAVILRDGFNYIFSVTPKSTVEQRKVTIGRVREDKVEILTRLSSKTEIVLTGGAFLEDGDKVQVIK